METAVAEFSCTWHYKDWVEIVGTILLFIVYPGLEFWLGRTRKVKAGSVLEILFNAGKYLIGRRKQPQLLLMGRTLGDFMAEDKEMLAGREFEKELGKLGTVFVDFKKDLSIEAGLTFDTVGGLQSWAGKSSNSVIKFIVAQISSFVGRSVPEIAPTEPVTPAPTEPVV